MPRRKPSTAVFSVFHCAVYRNRKTCKWCGLRVDQGYTVRRNKIIKGFVCMDCSDALVRFVEIRKGA